MPELGCDCWGEGLSGLDDFASDVFYCMPKLLEIALPPPVEMIIDAISLAEEEEPPPATIHWGFGWLGTIKAAC